MGRVYELEKGACAAALRVDADPKLDDIQQLMGCVKALGEAASATALRLLTPSPRSPVRQGESRRVPVSVCVALCRSHSHIPPPHSPV